MDASGPTSIVVHFERLSDPRVVGRCEHKLIDVIVIAILAVICGADGWVDVALFGAAQQTWLGTFLELPNGVPKHDTFGRIFSALDPKSFADCFIDWVSSLSQLSEGEIIPIDGKTLRRSFSKTLGKGAIHMVSAWAASNGVILGQRKVDDKSNEITAIPKLLELLDLNGATVTIDAMGTQTAIADMIVSRGGSYVLALKGNQQSLHEDVKLAFDGATQEILTTRCNASVETLDGDHGRVETRTHWTIGIDQLGLTTDWPGLKAIGVADRTRDISGKVENERQYFLLSDMMSALDFSRAIRAHWSIENNLHWALDVSFREDESRVRTGHAAENLSSLRRIALGLLKKVVPKQGGGIAARRKLAGWDHDFLLKVLKGDAV